MKKIILNIVFILSIFLTSCTDVLDKRPLDLYTESDIWTNADLAQNYLYRLYGGSVGSIGYSYGADNFSDMQSDLVFTRWVSSANKNDDGWTVNNNFGWNKFGDIRAINLAIKNLQNPEFNVKMSEADNNHLLGQAYLLKAAIYFQQARKFGGWIIVDKVLDEYADSDEGIAQLKLPRSTMKETYDYTIKLLEDAAPLMKVETSSGVLNKASAYALLSEVCIHAGAYMGYYGSDNSDKGTTVDTKPYFEKAIKAVEDIDLLSKYSLESAQNFPRIFENYSYSQTSKEVILGMYRNDIYTQTRDEEFRRRYGKLGISFVDVNKFNLDFQKLDGYTLNGYCTINPDPRAIEATFYVIDDDGKARRFEESNQFKNNFDIVKEASQYADSKTPMPEKRKLKPNSGYTNVTEAMFSNRDQRFYTGMVWDGSSFMSQTLYTRTGGNFYPSSSLNVNHEAGALTGYAFRKFIPEITSLGDGTPQLDMVTAVIFRLGRCYLNAAEAYIHLADLGVANAEVKAREYMNRTRTTHGDLPALTNETGKELKKIYIDERTADLLLENDRYFLLLRSGVAWGVQDSNGYPDPSKKEGVITNLTGGEGTIPYLLIEVPGNFKVESDFMKPNAYFYREFFFNQGELKLFTPKKRYLLNVPKSELDQNENLWQNKNWE